MISDRERSQIEKAVSRHYEYSKADYDGNSVTFTVDGLDSYVEESFNSLVDDLSSIGFVCFTPSSDTNLITVIRSIGTRRQNYLLRVILLVASLISVVYVGYTYTQSYNGSSSSFYVLGISLMDFTLPLFVIFLSRELAKFFIMARNGMKYSLPLFVPDPLGLGTMGFINTPSQAFKTRRSMIETGSASLIAGFVASIVIILIGNLNASFSAPATASINSPVQTLSSPLIFQIFFNRFMPSLGILDPLSFAGWIGIVVNSFNAFPAGYLDGGLISTAIFGRKSVYISYASIAAIIGLGIIYPPWVLLAIFVVLLGIKGPEPLNNISRIYVPGKVLAVVAFAILLLGMVPFPYHIVNSNFNVQADNQNFVIINGTRSNISIAVNLQNEGQSTMVPAFSISPNTQLKVQGPGRTLSQGQNATYHLTMPFSHYNQTGMYNYSLTTYSGEVSRALSLHVYVVNLSDQLSFTSQNPFSTYMPENRTLNFTEKNTGLSVLHLSVASFSNSGLKYLLTGSNLMIPLGSSQKVNYPILVEGGQSISLSLKAESGTGTVTVLTFNQNYSASIAYIQVGGTPPGHSSGYL